MYMYLDLILRQEAGDDFEGLLLELVHRSKTLQVNTP
jgi:hypothetical protein